MHIADIVAAMESGEVDLDDTATMDSVSCCGF